MCGRECVEIFCRRAVHDTDIRRNARFLPWSATMLIRSKGSASSMKPAGQTISNRLLVSLAAPALHMAALSLPLLIYLPEFYENDLGLDLEVVGQLFTVVRLGDLFFEPFGGGLL